jgi:hypothetical protein
MVYITGWFILRHTTRGDRLCHKEMELDHWEKGQGWAGGQDSVPGPPRLDLGALPLDVGPARAMVEVELLVAGDVIAGSSRPACRGGCALKRTTCSLLRYRPLMQKNFSCKKEPNSCKARLTRSRGGSKNFPQRKTIKPEG